MCAFVQNRLSFVCVCCMRFQHLLSSLQIQVFERGWLSSNCILMLDDKSSALVDSGYHSHSPQTLSWLQARLNDRPLDYLLNTHLHSDHCGANAALQTRYPGLVTVIPNASSLAVEHWDLGRLTFADTGQVCPPFSFNQTLIEGQCLRLGGLDWFVHLAKGHDPDSVVLFQSDHGILISADALWENGFGVVFPEMSQRAAFDDVERTLDMIEELDPAIVIPGHGPVFENAPAALARARSRLSYFREHPQKHTRHGIKVLIKFKLLEWQRVCVPDLLLWCRNTPLICTHMPLDAAQHRVWLDVLLHELSDSSALRREDDVLINT